MNIDERIQALHVNIESLHANMGELFDVVRELRGNISELSQTVRALGETVGQVGHALSELAHVATVHEKRLDRYEVTVVAFQEDVRDIKTELRAIRERLEGFGNGSKFN
jgi:uncharacterized coiled-coil DUF342 family protein